MLNTAKVERDFEAAADVANRHGALFWELRGALDLAQLRLTVGRRTEEAAQILSAVYGRFSEGFDRADGTRLTICSTLSRLEALTDCAASNTFYQRLTG